jgi:hypothetical protein
MIVETLSRSLDWGGFVRPLVPIVEDFLHAAGTREILDLCAGAGGPARILSREMKRSGVAPPTILMTDLFPRVSMWEKAKREHHGIDFIGEPVDATRISPALSRGRARTIVNAFHHFPPEMARSILQDAVAHRAPIFIAEAFERDPLGALPLIPVGIPALLASPVLSPGDRLAKAAWAWMTPVGMMMGAWDAIVSTLRVYSEQELRDLVTPFGSGYEWIYGTYDYPFGGRGCYFYGVPVR